MAVVGIGRSEVARLDRIARADGLRVVRAEDRAQSKAWGGELAIFNDASFLFADHCADSVRAWLHTNGLRRTA